MIAELKDTKTSIVQLNNFREDYSMKKKWTRKMACLWNDTDDPFWFMPDLIIDEINTAIENVPQTVPLSY